MVPILSELAVTGQGVAGVPTPLLVAHHDATTRVSVHERPGCTQAPYRQSCSHALSTRSSHAAIVDISTARAQITLHAAPLDFSHVQLCFRTAPRHFRFGFGFVL